MRSRHHSDKNGNNLSDRGAVKAPFDAFIERQFATPDSVDNNAGGVRAIPDFEFQFQIERHIAEGAPFHADMAEFPVRRQGT